MSAGNPPNLICGRDPSEVWDHAVAGHLDAHERGCTSCQAVVADYHSLRGPVSQYLSEPVEPPTSLAERIMARVRAELRPREWLILGSPHGPVRLKRSAAAAVQRHLIDQVPGVRARRCRIFSLVQEETVQDETVAHSDHAGSELTAAPEVEVAVSISVAVDDLDIPTAVASVRRVLVAGTHRLLSLTVARVDVDVVDLYDPEQDFPRRP